MGLLFAMFLIGSGIAVIVIAAVMLFLRGRRIFATIQDMHGNPMEESCSAFEAEELIRQGEATLVGEKPMTIRLTRPRSPEGLLQS